MAQGVFSADSPFGFYFSEKLSYHGRKEENPMRHSKSKQARLTYFFPKLPQSAGADTNPAVSQVSHTK